ncbi:MAG: efflux RND transporter periplasmic adaptor subunit [Silicimonas sp.]|nr:efflux RND transporter periplasmic adaptor subunit [Silicimonas sp.]
MKRLIASLALCALPLAAPAQEAPRLVKLLEVAESSASVTRQFFGSVAARETVDLAFQVGGQIVELPLVEGERLTRDALIARLDLEPFELALDQARVQKDQADRTLDRLQKLQGGTVSQVTVDDAETQVQLAEIAVRDAERSLRNAELHAPFDALVASRFAANFSTIAAGTPIARLHDMSELRVEIDVPEVLFQRAGSDPNLTLLAEFPASEERFPLSIREFKAETSTIGQTFQISLGLAPPEGLVILPGSSVTVYATVEVGATALVVPNAAIAPANDGSPRVMIFEPAGADEGTVRAVPVTVEPDAEGKLVITSGVEPGQEIVASGAGYLNEGETVRRFTGFSN